MLDVLEQHQVPSSQQSRERNQGSRAGRCVDRDDCGGAPSKCEEYNSAEHGRPRDHGAQNWPTQEHVIEHFDVQLCVIGCGEAVGVPRVGQNLSTHREPPKRPSSVLPSTPYCSCRHQPRASTLVL